MKQEKNVQLNIVQNLTGMSHQALARYIGVKRNDLALYLSGKEPLEVSAGLKMEKIANILSLLPKQIPSQNLSTIEKEKLQKQVGWYRIQFARLQKKLKQMEQDAIKTNRLLQLVTALQQEETEMTAERERWYKCQFSAVEIKLSKSRNYLQLKLRVKMAAIYKEKEMYEIILKA